MAEYIERGPLIEICENQGHADIDDILNVEVADVAPVVHGKWVLDRRIAGGAYFKCSLCGRFIEVIGSSTIERFPYCHCGAKMDR